MKTEGPRACAAIIKNDSILMVHEVYENRSFGHCPEEA